MPLFRSDLTLETAEQLGAYGKNAKRLDGVRSMESLLEGYTVSAITVTSEEGSRALDKPVGRYITVDLQPYFQRQDHFFPRGVRCLSRELRHLLPRLKEGDTVLVAGLGNRQLACDAINGYIVRSGEEFSLNTVLGELTTEAGYRDVETLVGKTILAEDLAPHTEIIVDFNGSALTVATK